jgi:hypothetical protein
MQESAKEYNDNIYKQRVDFISLLIKSSEQSELDLVYLTYSKMAKRSGAFYLSFKKSTAGR